VTGYERGAITPFGAAQAWPVIADASVLAHETVAIGGGARGVNVHLGSRELVDALRAEVADVSVAS
jgi:prolyl-tRNA editing enzyme YbaK/EbsC (Cys-tRNA(Pro) deacylase)